MIKEEQLLEKRELRDQLASKIEVLHQVKESKLQHIYNLNISTVKQIAAYYKVEEETIQKLYQRNKEELDSAGVYNKKYNEFHFGHNVQLETTKGKAIFYYNKGEILSVPMRGLKVFTDKAILIIGMLLRDSNVAKELRNILANQSIQIAKTGGYVDENREEEFLINYFPSFSEETKLAMVQDLRNQNVKFKKDIEKLQQDNKALAGEILAWEDRSKINFAVRKLAKKLHTREAYVWGDLYKELNYKHHINVKMRGKKPWIQHIKEDEWSKVIKSFSAICEDKDVSPSDILNNLKEV